MEPEPGPNAVIQRRATLKIIRIGMIKKAVLEEFTTMWDVLEMQHNTN